MQAFKLRAQPASIWRSAEAICLWFLSFWAVKLGVTLGTIGGSPGLITISINAYAANAGQAGLLAHDLGHNLGLVHSHSYACTTAIYNPTINCGLIECGDDFDTMGGAWAVGDVCTLMRPTKII
jgi:hypothetical protein